MASNIRSIATGINLSNGLINYLINNGKNIQLSSGNAVPSDLKITSLAYIELSGVLTGKAIKDANISTLFCNSKDIYGSISSTFTAYYYHSGTNKTYGLVGNIYYL